MPSALDYDLLLTVNGRPEVVVQDAEVYQAMVERLQEMEDLVAIREGLAQAEAGNARPASEVFAEWSPSGTGLATG